MSSIAVLGAPGMLGHDLVDVLSVHHDVTGFSKDELDITDKKTLEDRLPGFDTVINAAAYTKVDDAETHESLAFAINAVGAGNVAEVCARRNLRLVHISTDYVFDGTSTVPYDENHPLNPQSAYGRSKAQGEREVLGRNPSRSLIVRTAWLYGEHGPNFVTTMLKLAAERDTVSVVTDQIGQPTWSKDLATMVLSLVDSPLQSGIFHGTNAGHTSWFDFAKVIFETAGLDPARVLPTTSADFQRPAPRPAWSVLGHDAWRDHGFQAPRPWHEAFREAWTAVFAESSA